MTTVLLATHARDALSVFARDAHGGLSQVAQLVARGDVDPLSVTTLVSDLDLQLGWSLNGVETNGHALARSTSVAVGPARRELPATSTSRTSRALNASQAALLGRFSRAGRPVTLGEVGGEADRYALKVLLTRGLVVETGERTETGARLFAVVESVDEHEPESRPHPDFRKRPRAGRKTMRQRTERILDVLSKGGEMTHAQIAEATGMTGPGPASTVRRILDRAVDAGQVYRRQTGTHGGVPRWVFGWGVTPGEPPGH